MKRREAWSGGEKWREWYRQVLGGERTVYSAVANCPREGDSTRIRWRKNQERREVKSGREGDLSLSPES